MKNKNIAVIGLKGLPAFGGAATVGENIIIQLNGKYNFTVYSTSSHTELKSGDYKGICSQIIFTAIPFKRINTLYYYVLSAIHALLFGKYDIIHLHHSDAAFLIPFLKIRYKVIVTTHGAHISGLRPKWLKYKWFFQGQIKHFLKYADEITCVSKKEEQWLEEIHHLHATYIPNGINIVNDLKTVSTKSDIFFGAGRIIKSKGCDLLLNALHKIEFGGKILIAGDLNQSSENKKEILQLSQGLDVSFLGLIIDKNKLLSYIKKSLLFVFPSLQEAMSIMLLEAASVRVPIVCSDIRENRDIFSDEDVLFFSLEKKFDLGKKITWAFDNYDIMINKAEKAYNRVTTTNNWNYIKDDYKKIYNSLI